MRLTLVAVGAVVLQTSIFTLFRFDGVAPELPILLAALAGYAAGAERGAWFGFGIGLLYDVLLPSPLGLAALTCAVVAWLVGVLTSGLMHPTWWTATVFGASMTALGVGLFAVAGEVFGQRYVSLDLLRIMAFVGLLSLILAPAASWLMRWCYGQDPNARTASG
ncbi:MAG: rod shape-determining protein MreD [Acidimicrobiia bacterium]|nr:rod shape-determining protein MreD [Acidimicrobiia bacterium]MDH5238555.1 rod shape-determining protein MreD [Acidimicrobiia bacterium]